MEDAGPGMEYFHPDGTRPQEIYGKYTPEFANLKPRTDRLSTPAQRAFLYSECMLRELQVPHAGKTH